MLHVLHSLVLGSVLGGAELAAVDILCSDKTGTLTLNQLSIDMSLVESLAEGVSVDDILRTAAYASRLDNPDAIDSVVLNSLPKGIDARQGMSPIDFTPFDPVRKRTEMKYTMEGRPGKVHLASKGLPSTLLDVVGADEALRHTVTQRVDDYAARGLRGLGVAEATVSDSGEAQWRE